MTKLGCIAVAALVCSMAGASAQPVPIRLGHGPAAEEQLWLMKAKPDLNRQSTLDQLMVDIELLDSKNSKGKIGWGAQADWDQTLAILKNYRELSTDKGWTAFHTNEFLPQ